MIINASREQIKTTIDAMAKQVGAKVLKFKRYSSHPDDGHLYTVLCKITTLKDKSYVKYVTWLANICPGIESFGHGHYYEGYIHETSEKVLLENAEKDYAARVFTPNF